MTNIFDEMTKKEIVTWIRQSWFPVRYPRKSEVLFLRWQRKSDDLLTKERQHLEQGRKRKSWAAKHDEYVAAFNKSKNAEEKICLAKKMMGCSRECQKWLDESKSMSETFNRLDRLYKQYEAERKKEMAEVKTRCS